jgi:hypothetical protein
MMQRREPKDVVLHDDHLLGVLLGDRAAAFATEISAVAEGLQAAGTRSPAHAGQLIIHCGLAVNDFVKYGETSTYNRSSQAKGRCRSDEATTASCHGAAVF